MKLKKNKNYESNNEIENELKFDKIDKNQNKKSKHWGSNIKYHQNIELKGTIKNSWGHKFIKKFHHQRTRGLKLCSTRWVESWPRGPEG